ncbi:MAG: hypothetical protein OYH77_03180, partial [Pseudomonadota bacterium]|nr:hypothetical protein [Pseudomonadota bacterium]
MLALTSVVCALLALRWRKQLGLLTASLAALCRFLWLVPLLTTLFPQTISSEKPDSFKQQTIHVFVDDSTSMQGKPLAQARQTLQYLQQRCKSCDIRVSYLSSLTKDKNFSRLSLVLPSWYAQIAAGDAWLLFTDGGDFQPYLEWQAVLPAPSNRRGLVIGVPPRVGKNIWLAGFHLPHFAFADSDSNAEVEIGQQGITGKQQVQVQIVAGDDEVLTSKNIMLQQDKIRVNLSVPARKQGTHILTAKLLPLAAETNTWDNSRQKALEILPNTT